MEGTGFLPSRDGFPFRNEFDYPATRLGRSAPLAAGFGLAGGMCLSALDRWQAGRPLPAPAAAPEPGDVLYEELARRQVELLNHGAWDRILEWQRRPGFGGFFGERGVGELTREEWRRARRSIARGMPVLLCVLRTRGPFANPSENPFVLAYRYEAAKDAKRGTFWVYDPNRPGNDDVKLTIVPGGRRRAPEITFVSERVRGFFVLPYDRPTATPLRAAELKEPSAGGMNGRAAALPGAGPNAIVRARNGGLVVVRAGKAAAEPRVQRIEGDVLVSDPVVIAGRMPTILARAKDGTVVGFRRGVTGWRGRPMPTPKTPLQLDFGPVVVHARGSVHAFGVKDGRLAHLRRSRAGMWSGGIVNAQTGAGASERLEGTPSAVVDAAKVIRVFTRTESGRIAHMTLSGDGRWSASLLPAADGAIAGDALAVVVPGDDQITVFAVSEQGELIQLRGGADAWRARNLTRETAHDGGPHLMRVEITATEGPGNTLHVFGVSPRNGLVHFWSPPTLAWRAQDLTFGRVETGDLAKVRGRPSVVRTADDQLVVAAAAERGLVVYRWSTAGDWTGDVLPMPDGFTQRVSPEGPVVWRDAKGQAYLHASFDDGRAIVAVPARPDSKERTLRVEPARANRPRPARAEPQPATPDATSQPRTGTESQPSPPAPAASTPAAQPFGMPVSESAAGTPLVPAAADEAAAGSFGQADGTDAVPMIDLDAVDMGPLAAAPGSGSSEPSSFGSLDLPEFGLGGMDSASDDDAGALLDLGSMSMGAATDATPELGSGSGANAIQDAGGFQPSAPLLPDPGGALGPLDLPDAFVLPASDDASRREKEERARREEEERARLEAEADEKRRAEEAERARAKAAADAKRRDEERARAEAQAARKAEEEERARLKAEAAAKKKAEEEERARLKAEAEAKKKAEAKRKAEEEERARLKAEAEAKKAEEKERARKKAEAEAKKKAEEAERTRIAAEAAAKKAEEKARLEAEQEARRAAEEEAKRAAEEEARRAADEEAKRAEEAERAAAAAKRTSRPLSPALEGLPLLDDEVKPRDPVASEDAKPAAPAKAKDGRIPKSKLRSIDDLIRLADDHDPTFEKK